MSKILIVDDNPEMLDRLIRIAKRVDNEFRIVAVKSAAEAAMAVEREEDLSIAIFDVFLSEPKNKRFPEGIGLINRLRAVQPQCFNILFSSQAKDIEAIRAEARDFDSSTLDDFVSAFYANRDWRSQLEQSIMRGKLRAIDAVVN